MASITIRNLDDHVKARLRVRAAIHGRSMEQEARDILKVALAEEPAGTLDLAKAIRQRLAKFGGIALQLPERAAVREPPVFDS